MARSIILNELLMKEQAYSEGRIDFNMKAAIEGARPKIDKYDAIFVVE